MTILWWTFAALISISLLFLVVPLLWRSAQGAGLSHHKANLNLYREHLAELEQQVQRGELDNSQFESLQAELQRNLLKEEKGGSELIGVKVAGGNWLIWVLAILLPVAAVLTYNQLGASRDLAIVEDLQQANQLLEGQDAEQLPVLRKRMIANIDQRLKQDPDNFYYWVLSARLSSDEGKLEKSLDAYRKAEKLSPNDETLLKEYFEVAFQVAGGLPTPEIVSLLERLATISPNDLQVLVLSGRFAFDEGDYPRALARWERALTLLPKDHELSGLITSGVETARAKLAESGKSDVQATIKLKIVLANTLSLNDGDVLFVIARRPGVTAGPPLAVKKVTVDKLPIEIELNDSNLMLPGSSLGDMESVDIIVRLSSTGSPQAQLGDRQGTRAGVVIAEDAVTDILIDQQID
ncbi:c-type cytochrome biogenesis protein CcmI [Porticoccaceae bacterium LTM1]|nr:c-type cytochrome biogenesis protein CcmI [Porticoccaceae bacterium LTM1]